MKSPNFVAMAFWGFVFLGLEKVGWSALDSGLAVLGTLTIFNLALTVWEEVSK